MIDLDVHLEGIVAGQTTAFARWMAGGEPALRDSLRRFAASVDTEAVLQESLLRLWQVAPRFEADGKPNAFLRLGVRIARNLAISETRRLGQAPLPIDAIDEAPDPVAPAPPDPLLRKTIEECRDRLPPKPALALNARLAGGGGTPDAELALGLGMRTNTFLQNFTRARKLLLDCLEEHGVELEVELT